MTLLASTGLATAFPILFALACPLMMILMMRGMHGHGGHRHGHAGPAARDEPTLDELRAERDALDEEIARRTSDAPLLPPMKERTMSEVTYSVPDVSCAHCVHAITSEVQTVAGVESVEVDLEAKTVTVRGEPLDEQAIVAAIDEAGYAVAA